MGASFLTFMKLDGKVKSKPIQLYLNIYEKGALQVPVGLSIKK
jgi:hypothetical protein